MRFTMMSFLLCSATLGSATLGCATADPEDVDPLASIETSHFGAQIGSDDSPLLINEAATRLDVAAADFIELENVGSAPYDLSAHVIRVFTAAGRLAFVIGLPVGGLELDVGEYFGAVNVSFSGSPPPKSIVYFNDLPDGAHIGLFLPDLPDGSPGDLLDKVSMREFLLSRCPDGQTTGNDLVDFQRRPPTLGELNDCP